MGQFRLDETMKLDKKNVSTYIKDMVMESLLRGELKPGDKLPTEYEFMEQLGVSRNSIREAIKMLSSLGVIEIRRGEGTYIADTMSDSVLNPLVIQLAFAQRTPQELIELRIFFDTAVAELVLAKMRDGDLDKLEQINEQMRQEMERQEMDSEKVSSLDYKFHTELIKLTRNCFMVTAAAEIYTLFFFIHQRESAFRREPEL